MLNVLIADDELMARRRLARHLAMLEGVTLMAECEDGPQALERLRHGGVSKIAAWTSRSWTFRCQA